MCVYACDWCSGAPVGFRIYFVCVYECVTGVVVIQFVSGFIVHACVCVLVIGVVVLQ